MIRGGGYSALNALAIYKNGIFRPLLIFTEQEMNTIFKNEKWNIFEDESNESEEYLRNRLRKNVIPLLKKEGLNPNKVYENFHEEEDSLLLETNPNLKNKNPGFIRIDYNVLDSMNTMHLKQVLDVYCSVFKIHPINKNILLEIKKELANNTSFLIENKELYFWKSKSSDLYLIPKSSPYLLKAKIVSSKEEAIVHWNEKTKPISNNMRLDYFTNGLKILSKGKHFEVSELLREKHIPIPVRECLPIIFRDNNPVAILFSLWDDRLRDFIGDLYYEQR